MSSYNDPNRVNKETSDEVGVNREAYGKQGDRGLEETREHLEEQWVKVKDQVQEAYEAGKTKMEEITGKVRKSIPEVSDQSLENLYKSFIGYVQANPDKAVFASLAIGFLLGSLFKRR